MMPQNPATAANGSTLALCRTGTRNRGRLTASTANRRNISGDEEAMKRLIIALVYDEQGQDLIEYALLGAFVSIAAVVGATYLGSKLNLWYSGVGLTVSGMKTAP